MEYKTIGGSGEGGLRVSAVGLGCNAFGRRCDEGETAAILHEAIDAGINFFDTANSYGDGLSEVYMGKALAGRRGDVVLATKFGLRDGGSRKIVMDSIEKSLTALGTDYVDLYQMHKPDPDTPIEETLAALDELVRAGKVRFIGCSNFTGVQLEQALAHSDAAGAAAFVTAQNPYNLLNRDIEAELVPACRARGVGILPFYPLQQGLLTGKYRRGEAPPRDTRLAGTAPGSGVLSDANFDCLAALEAFAAERGHTLHELAISWLASQPVIASVIAGAAKPGQALANSRAADWVLSEDDFAALDAIVPPPAMNVSP